MLVCGRNLITGLTSAASPRVDISSTCKVGQKLRVSLHLLTCSCVAGTWLQDWHLPRHQGWTYRAPVRYDRKLECLSLCWHAPLWRDRPCYCTAEVGNPGGNYEWPCIILRHVSKVRVTAAEIIKELLRMYGSLSPCKVQKTKTGDAVYNYTNPELQVILHLTSALLKSCSTFETPEHLSEGACTKRGHDTRPHIWIMTNTRPCLLVAVRHIKYSHSVYRKTQAVWTLGDFCRERHFNVLLLLTVQWIMSLKC